MATLLVASLTPPQKIEVLRVGTCPLLRVLANPDPSGFVSVPNINQVSPGGLNYDEVVVYNEDAALPTNLIVYSFY